jgi:hypothetical protein
MPAPHPDRRRFLSLLAAAGVGGVTAPSRLWGAVRVDAAATPLFAQPDGLRCLVRFYVSGLDAPAGRLRVFDARGRLLGTAGMLPAADGRLYGELWVALGALNGVRTELAAPGLHAPLVSWHAPHPAPRWTIYWTPLLQAATLDRSLQQLGPIPRSVLALVLHDAGARLNPLPATLPTATGDVPFLRLVDPALRASRASDLRLATFAAAEATTLQEPTLAAVLAGSGVRRLVVLDSGQAGVYRLTGWDGTPLVAVAPSPAADAERLGFFEGGRPMAQAVERFLVGAQPGDDTAPSPMVGTGTAASALVVGGAGDQLANATRAVKAWNAGYAYPRIVLGDATAYFDAVERHYGDRIAAWPTIKREPVSPPTLRAATAAAAARAGERSRRATAMLDCLARLLPQAGTGLDAIARQFALPIPGTLVFNPAPYSRTDVVRLEDGADHVVTDLPALGYAYFPLGMSGGGEWREMENDGQPLTVQTPQFQVALDPGSGAIRSLISPSDGRDWVAEGLFGLNDLGGAGLVETTRWSLAGVGMRIEALRRSAEHGAIRSTVTLYDHLPWIDVTNDAEASGNAAVGYRFAFAISATDAEWEVPAGMGQGTAPLDLAHLRWMRLMGARGSALLGSLDAAVAHVDETGLLTSFAPKGQARYRIALAGAGALASRDDPWRFGWGLDPLLTAPVSGTGHGTLPSFGRLLVVDQPAIAIVGVQWAADGDGVIVYLQELSGQQRVATIGAGLIGWTGARLVDLVERDLGAPAMTMVNGASVVLRPNGVAALKLLEPQLRGG